MDSFWNFVQKGVIARNEQLLLFPQCFLLNQIIIPPFVHIFDIKSLFAAELEELKISISGKGLNDTYQASDLQKNPYLLTEYNQWFVTRADETEDLQQYSWMVPYEKKTNIPITAV